MDEDIFRSFYQLLFISTWIKYHITAEATRLSVPLGTEGSQLSLTCEYSEGTVLYFNWFKRSNSTTQSYTNVGYILSESCEPFDPAPPFKPNATLYNYTCPSASTQTMVVRIVTSGNHGEIWRCSAILSANYTTITSNSVTISVQVPVTNVALSPSTDVTTLNVSQQATFECTVPRSLPSATIVWYKNSSGVISALIPSNSYSYSSNPDRTVMTTNRYTLSPSKTDSGVGMYCIASSGGASTTSRQTMLNVQFPPDSPPRIESFSADGSFFAIRDTQQTLTCSVTGGNPLATLKWNNCYGGTIDSPSSLSGTVSLRIAFVASSSEQPCTCTSSHILAGTLNMALNIKIFYPPTTPKYDVGSSSSIQPGTIKVVKGNNTDIRCLSTSYPAPNTWSWTRPTGTTEGQTLSLKNIQTSDQGAYLCVVKNTMVTSRSETVIRSTNSSIYVDVLYKSSVDRFGIVGNMSSSDITVNENVTSTLACFVDSNPGSTITLLKDGVSINMTENSRQLESSIRNGCTDAGVYTCSIANQHNKDGASMRNINYYVKCTPRPAPSISIDYNVTIAQQVNTALSFTALAYPPVEQVLWQKCNTSGFFPVSKGKETFSLHGFGKSIAKCNMTLLDVQQNDYGQYKLTITGSDSQVWSALFYLNAEGLRSNSKYSIELFSSNAKGNSSYVKETFSTLMRIDQGSSTTSSKSGVIAGSIVGGLIGLLVIVITVVALRKYELTCICKCARKESNGQALYEASAVSAINHGAYESLGIRNDIRRNQPDINSCSNDNELGTNAYDSLDAHQSSKHVYSELGHQPRTGNTRLYENNAVHLDSGTAVYVNTTFENA
ncbi:hemicentin-1-like isoform X3 [Dreissena polymorpha]|uniref:hemicentin-1-like isoform X3 n=1 Tax=Dreissena polymorpha TaxID=45954 RepID=UPI002264785B|nr:hemicentin-1-like isoform X3 [Dreissena polymorpha]